MVSFAIDESYPDNKDDNGKETLLAFTLWSVDTVDYRVLSVYYSSYSKFEIENW